MRRRLLPPINIIYADTVHEFRIFYVPETTNTWDFPPRRPPGPIVGNTLVAIPNPCKRGDRVDPVPNVDFFGCKAKARPAERRDPLREADLQRVDSTVTFVSHHEEKMAGLGRGSSHERTGARDAVEQPLLNHALNFLMRHLIRQSEACRQFTHGRNLHPRSENAILVRHPDIFPERIASFPHFFAGGHD